MSRYRAIFDGRGLKAEIEDGHIIYLRADPEHDTESDLARPMVIRDIEPYRSMIDGHMVTSRSEHREHLRINNCFEIGNENPILEKPKPVSTRRETLSRRLGDMSDKDANKLLKQLKKGP